MEFNYRNIKELVIGWARKDPQLHEALSRVDKSLTDINKFLNDPKFPRLAVGNLFFNSDRNQLNQGSAMTQACRRYHSLNQSIADISFQQLVFDSTDFDTDGMAFVADRITFKNAGYYMFGTQLCWASPSKDCFEIVYILKNNTTIILEESRRATYDGASSTTDCMNPCGIYYFNQGDYITVTVFHNEGGPRNINRSTDHSAILWAHRLS